MRLRHVHPTIRPGWRCSCSLCACGQVHTSPTRPRRQPRESRPQPAAAPCQSRCRPRRRRSRRLPLARAPHHSLHERACRAAVRWRQAATIQGNGEGVRRREGGRGLAAAPTSAVATTATDPTSRGRRWEVYLLGQLPHAHPNRLRCSVVAAPVAGARRSLAPRRDSGDAVAVEGPGGSGVWKAGGEGSTHAERAHLRRNTTTSTSPAPGNRRHIRNRRHVRCRQHAVDRHHRRPVDGSRHLHRPATATIRRRTHAGGVAHVTSVGGNAHGRGSPPHPQHHLPSSTTTTTGKTAPHRRRVRHSRAIAHTQLYQ